MKRSTDRILTTCGQPVAARGPDRFEPGARRGRAPDDAAYAQCLASAVAGVVRKQRELGVDIPDDGEFGKPMAANYDYGVWWNYAFAHGGVRPGESFPVPAQEVGVAELALTTIGKRRDWQKFSEFCQDPNRAARCSAAPPAGRRGARSAPRRSNMSATP